MPIVVDNAKDVISVFACFDEYDTTGEKITVILDESAKDGEFGFRSLVHTGEGDPNLFLAHWVTGGLACSLVGEIRSRFGPDHLGSAGMEGDSRRKVKGCPCGSRPRG